MDKNKTVIITVSGGVAEIYHNPENIRVIVIDYDNLNLSEYAYCPVCNKFYDEWPGICECGYDSELSEDQIFELDL